MKTLPFAATALAALSLACAAPAAAPPASASEHAGPGSATLNGGLVEDEAWATMSAELGKQIDKASSACATKLGASFDRDSFAGVDLDRAPVRSYARDSVYALSWICKGELAKKTVQSKVSRVVVRRSKDGTKVKLDGGTLVVLIDTDKTAIVGKSPGSYTWTSAIKEVL